MATGGPSSSRSLRPGRPETPLPGIQGTRETAARGIPNGGRRAAALPYYLGQRDGRRRPVDAGRILSTYSSRARRAEHRSTWSSGKIPSSSPTPFLHNYAGGVDRQGAGPAGRAIERATGKTPETTGIPMTATSPGDPCAGSGEVVPEYASAARRGLRRGAGQHLRPAGSNGAGKTTVVNILSTLLKPTPGRPPSTASTSPRSRRTCGNPSASPASSRRSTRSSPAGRTWCWWPGCGT